LVKNLTAIIFTMITAYFYKLLRVEGIILHCKLYCRKVSPCTYHAV